MGHIRALESAQSVVPWCTSTNNQLASDFSQLLSGEGQTIDNDHRADTSMTSIQLQKSIGNILGRPFHSSGTA